MEAVGCMICFSATYLKYIQLKQIHAALSSRNLLALAISHSSKCTADLLQRVSVFGKMLYLLVIQTCTFKMRTCSVYWLRVVGLHVTVCVCVACVMCVYYVYGRYWYGSVPDINLYNLYNHVCFSVSAMAYQSWLLYFLTDMSSSGVCTLPLKGEGHLSVSKQICIQCHI